MSWLRAFGVLTLVTALIGGLSVTVSRLWPTHTAPSALLTSFTPLALVAYGVCLVMIVCLGFGRWSLWWSASTVMILALIMLHVTWLAPSFTDSTSVGDPGTPLRILTINTQEGAADADQIVAAVDDHDVQVLIVEEITPQLAERLRAAGLSGRLPQEAGEGKLRYAGTVVFSTFPLTNQQALPTYFDSLRVSVQVPNGPVELVAVHPVTPIRDADLWRREHALIREASRDADIVVGDFNATLDHRPMRTLQDDGFRSAAEIAGTGWAPTWPSNGRGLTGPLTPRLIQIDHIMVRGWEVTGVRRVLIADTDHTGVYAELTRPD